MAEADLQFCAALEVFAGPGLFADERRDEALAASTGWAMDPGARLVGSRQDMRGRKRKAAVPAKAATSSNRISPIAFSALGRKVSQNGQGASSPLAKRTACS